MAESSVRDRETERSLVKADDPAETGSDRNSRPIRFLRSGTDGTCSTCWSISPDGWLVHAKSSSTGPSANFKEKVEKLKIFEIKKNKNKNKQ